MTATAISATTETRIEIAHPVRRIRNSVENRRGGGGDGGGGGSNVSSIGNERKGACSTGLDRQPVSLGLAKGPFAKTIVDVTPQFCGPSPNP